MKFNELDVQKMIKLYNQGIGTTCISRIFHCNCNAIRYHLKKNGIQLRTLSEATKEAIKGGRVKTFSGKKHTEKTKKIMSENHLGPKNPGWRGGIDKEGYSYLYRTDSVEGVKLHEKMYKKYNYKCFDCGKNLILKSGNLVLHHIDLNRTNDDLSNLILICRSCHVKTHKPRFGTGKES